MTGPRTPHTNGRHQPPDPLDAHLDALGTELTRGITRANRRRRRAIGLATATVTMAAISIGGLVAIPGGRDLDPVEQARAAITTQRGGILHYVVRVHFIGPGRTEPEPDERSAPAAEIWTDPAADQHYRVRSTATHPGSCGMATFVRSRTERGWRNLGRVPEGPVLVSPMDEARHGQIHTTYSAFSRAAVVARLDSNASAAPLLDLDAAGTPGDPVRTIRDALASGTLRDAGTITRDGRTLRQLVGTDGPSVSEAEALATRPPADQLAWRKRQRIANAPTIPTRYRYLVDADTFAPVELRTERYGLWSRAGGRDRWRWTTMLQRFERFERLGDTPAARRLLKIEMPPGTTVYRGDPDRGFTPRITLRDAVEQQRGAIRRCEAAQRRAATPTSP